MIYEVRADLFFDSEDEARDFYHDCELALAKSHNVNQDQSNMEYSIAELINNRHDEHPGYPCSVISRLIKK